MSNRPKLLRSYLLSREIKYSILTPISFNARFAPESLSTVRWFLRLLVKHLLDPGWPLKGCSDVCAWHI